MDRHSRFDSRPGDMHVPAAWAYPSAPVSLQSRWLVRMVVSGPGWLEQHGAAWHVDVHVWASSSQEATTKAQLRLEPAWACRATVTVRAVTQEAAA